MFDSLRTLETALRQESPRLASVDSARFATATAAGVGSCVFCAFFEFLRFLAFLSSTGSGEMIGSNNLAIYIASSTEHCIWGGFTTSA